MELLGLQLDTRWEAPPVNRDRVRVLLDQAEPSPGSLVVLPEMFATGFSMNVDTVCEPPGGETEQFLSRTAGEMGIWISGGVAVRHPDGTKENQQVVFDAEGKEQARYVKLQVFTPGKEAEHYRAGNETVIFEWAGFKVAPFICYDLRFPEVFRRAMRRGADLFIGMASWPNLRSSHWVKLLQARAIENQAFVIGVNRCGHDPFFTYDGRSLIVNPAGSVLVDAGEAEGVIRAEVSPEAVKDYRDSLPFLADTRPEFLKED